MKTETNINPNRFKAILASIILIVLSKSVYFNLKYGVHIVAKSQLEIIIDSYISMFLTAFCIIILLVRLVISDIEMSISKK